MEIRYMRIEDIPGVLELLDSTWPISDFNEAHRLAEKQSSDRHYRYLVVAFGADIAGFCAMLIEHKLTHHTGYVGHIEDVVVAEYYRGDGWGKRLIEAAVAACKDIGCYKVILSASKHNLAFYEKCGFYRNETTMRVDLG